MTQMRGLLALFWEDAVVAPPAPPPEEVCFPPVAAPVTAFIRASVASPGYARADVAGAAFARIGAPVDVALGGYGDDFGFDFGGETPDASAADFLVEFDRAAPGFDRITAATPTYSRGAVSGSYQRVGGPAAVTGFGYGDGFGENFGGDAAAATADYLRQSVTGSYQRAAPPSELGAIRSSAPGLSSARMDEPDCVPGVGYGDDFSFNFGGGVE